MAGIAHQIADRGQPCEPPCLSLSGGKTTVTVRGNGRGGRDGIYELASDTDGVDGMEEIAGAVWRPETLSRAGQLNLKPRHFLETNDAHSFFSTLGDSVATGPTRTNANDFRAILVL